MDAEESLRSKYLYKIELYLIKIIPAVLAAISLLNTVLSYCGIDMPLLSYVGGISLLPLIFLYISSYVFRFCIYHRIFLHYVSITWILNIIDYYWGIPVSDKGIFLLYMSITGVFLFLLLYLHMRKLKQKRSNQALIPRG